MSGFTRKSAEIVIRNIIKGGGVSMNERDYSSNKVELTHIIAPI